MYKIQESLAWISKVLGIDRAGASRYMELSLAMNNALTEVVSLNNATRNTGEITQLTRPILLLPGTFLIGSTTVSVTSSLILRWIYLRLQPGEHIPGAGPYG